MSKIKGKAETAIYIVEDHPIFRKGLVQLIENEEGFTVCGESDEYVQALNEIKKLKPDFVVVDIGLKDASGIDLIKDLKLYLPDVLVLTLSMHDEKIYGERALRAGARGYLMKQEAPETVITAIRHILGGKIYVSEELSARMLERMVDGRESASPVDLLSDRELEVFNLIGSSFSTREIAEKLHISIKTVENHRAHIKEKLGLKNSIELIQKATLWVQEKE